MSPTELNGPGTKQDKPVSDPASPSFKDTPEGKALAHIALIKMAMESGKLEKDLEGLGPNDEAVKIARSFPIGHAVKVSSNTLSSNWKSQAACFSSSRGGKKVDPDGMFQILSSFEAAVLVRRCFPSGNFL